MKGIWRAGSAVIVVACALGAPVFAHAEDAAAATPQAASGTDSSATSGKGLAEIVVTAQRRSERLQNVPISITAANADTLAKARVENVSNIGAITPSVTFRVTNIASSSANLVIRGLGTAGISRSFEGSVGVFIDGVYRTRAGAALQDFLDIDNLQVLRGAQGTLFGKNTTAGAISIVSRLPEFTPSASQEFSYGSRNWLQVKATATAPLIGDTIAWRVSGQITRRDGVIHNVRSNTDVNDMNNRAVRGQLLIRPTTGLSVRLIADYTAFDSECCTQVWLRVGTSLRPASRQYAALAAAAHYAPASTNAYDRLTDIDAALGVHTNEGGLSANTDWNLGPVTLTSISAWRFWNWDAANDRDYTGLQIQTVQHIPSRQDQLSQELRIASNGDHRLSYVAGLYAFRQVLTGHPISTYGAYAAPWLIGATTGASATPVPANLLDGYGQTGDTRLATNSYAAFAEANLRLVPGVIATGGLRYTREIKDGAYATTVSGGLATTSAALNAAKLLVLRPQAYAAHDAEGSLSGRANLSWQIRPDVMAYVSWARGFKSGGINMSGLPLDAANNPVLSTAVIRPERNQTWELGAKTRLFDRHLTLNADLYRTRVHDFQSTVVDSSQTVALRGYLSNIPEVTVKGAEADAALHWGGLTVAAALAYADGRYTSYPAGPCPLEVQTSGTTACDLTGKPLVGLSKWSESLGADWTLPVHGTPLGEGALALHSDTQWRSAYNGDPSLSAVTGIDAYTLTNASIGWRAAAGWEVAVFARNLFKADYIQNLTVQAGNSGLILGTPSDPRVIGVTFRARE